MCVPSDVRVCVHTDGLTLSESDSSWRWYGQQVTSSSIITLSLFIAYYTILYYSNLYSAESPCESEALRAGNS